MRFRKVDASQAVNGEEVRPLGVPSERSRRSDDAHDASCAAPFVQGRSFCGGDGYSCYDGWSLGLLDKVEKELACCTANGDGEPCGGEKKKRVRKGYNWQGSGRHGGGI